MYTYQELINPYLSTINELAKNGWRVVGVGVVTNHTGADRIVYLEKHVDKPSA